MKFPKKVTAAALAALMLNACAAPSNINGQEGGTVVGAVAGGLVGSMFGHGIGQIAAMGAGAVIGGVAGNEIGKDYDSSRSNH